MTTVTAVYRVEDPKPSSGCSASCASRGSRASRSTASRTRSGWGTGSRCSAATRSSRCWRTTPTGPTRSCASGSGNRRRPRTARPGGGLRRRPRHARGAGRVAGPGGAAARAREHRGPGPARCRAAAAARRGCRAGDGARGLRRAGRRRAATAGAGPALPCPPARASPARPPNQSLTTVFLARLARELYPESRFVRRVERLEAREGLRFEDEVLRQFSGPSFTVLRPAATARSRSAPAPACAIRPRCARCWTASRRTSRESSRACRASARPGLTSLLLIAPDAPLTPGAFGLLAAVDVRRLAGSATEQLYEVSGLDTGGARPGPDRVTYGLIGDAFVVASSAELAREVATMQPKPAEEAGTRLRADVARAARARRRPVRRGREPGPARADRRRGAQRLRQGRGRGRRGRGPLGALTSASARSPQGHRRAGRRACLRALDVRSQGTAMTAVADLKQTHRATWASGDYAAVAELIDDAPPSDLFARVPLAPGQDVLDVAAGTGNLAIRAAAEGRARGRARPHARSCSHRAAPGRARRRRRRLDRGRRRGAAVRRRDLRRRAVDLRRAVRAAP